MTTQNATTPISGLGGPKMEACGVLITEPQASTGLMLQLGTNSGSLSISIFSTNSVAEAIRPITPAMSTHHALARRTGTPSRSSAVVGSTGRAWSGSRRLGRRRLGCGR